MSHERYYLEDRLRVPFAGSLKPQEETNEAAPLEEKIFPYKDGVFPMETGESLPAAELPRIKPLGY